MTQQQHELSPLVRWNTFGTTTVGAEISGQLRRMRHIFCQSLLHRCRRQQRRLLLLSSRQRQRRRPSQQLSLLMFLTALLLSTRPPVLHGWLLPQLPPSRVHFFYTTTSVPSGSSWKRTRRKMTFRSQHQPPPPEIIIQHWHHTILHLSNRQDDDDNSNDFELQQGNNNNNKKRLGDDISRRLSISKDRAISALSQKPTDDNAETTNSRNSRQSRPQPRGNNGNNKAPAVSPTTKQKNRIEDKRVYNKQFSLLPPPAKQTNQRGNEGSTRISSSQPSNDSRKRIANPSAGAVSSRSNAARGFQTTPSPARNRSPQSATGTSKRQPKSKRTNTSSNNNTSATFSSLLPPPMLTVNRISRSDNTVNGGGDDAATLNDGFGVLDEYDDEDDDDVDSVANGLSSWEEFLEAGANAGGEGYGLPPSPPRRKTAPSSGSSAIPRRSSLAAERASSLGGGVGEYLESIPSLNHERLPSIQDLFPPSLSSGAATSRRGRTSSDASSYPRQSSPPSSTTWPSSSVLPPSTYNTNNIAGNIMPGSLDGVLPVSDLFYRSSQAQEDGVDEEGANDDDEEHDDEELPFSAEQSDALTCDENKVVVRQNLAAKTTTSTPSSSSSSSTTRSKRTRKGQQPPSTPSTVSVPSNKSSRDEAAAAAEATANANLSRKMIRRGMDMLVGGVPINADPPQRSVQLMYEASVTENNDSDATTTTTTTDWASCISLNTRAFGPLLHVGSASKVPAIERGIFCEHFCHSTIKWDICPKDLHQIVKLHYREGGVTGTTTKSSLLLPEEDTDRLDSVQKPSSKQDTAASNTSKDPASTNSIVAEQSVADVTSTDMSTPFDNVVGMYGECTFEIGVTREELESGDYSGTNDGGTTTSIFQDVCTKALRTVLGRALDNIDRETLNESYHVEISQLTLSDTEEGYTSVTMVFHIKAEIPQQQYSIEIVDDMSERIKQIEDDFIHAMEGGDIALAIAGAAKEEQRWSPSVRERVVEECLFPDDDVDESAELQWKRSEIPLLNTIPTATNNNNKVSSPAVDNHRSGRSSNDDLYRGGNQKLRGVGGANQRIYADYSVGNIRNAPYSGEIGPLLVDAVQERAKQRQPKVIAIGDVHGCIDELQDLLRQCDYRPGDLVVFLGDLVCKGPDSISVVQMAREIGAIGVRGNHDFEVVRWHHAMKSGVDPPSFGSEHYHIASCLSKADMNWMYSLPWYISSKDLGALFVHAGFVSGIRLAKQNPRLMMNMRSVLPDGTVTSKFFNNWPWARLWDGPQTVLFGHDADRGLQQYEHAIGLDTGCVYGGRLTACILPEKRLVSVSARREYFKYRRKHYD